MVHLILPWIFKYHFSRVVHVFLFSHASFFHTRFLRWIILFMCDQRSFTWCHMFTRSDVHNRGIKQAEMLIITCGKTYNHTWHMLLDMEFLELTLWFGHFSTVTQTYLFSHPFFFLSFLHSLMGAFVLPKDMFSQRGINWALWYLTQKQVHHYTGVLSSFSLSLSSTLLCVFFYVKTGQESK